MDVISSIEDGVSGSIIVWKAIQAEIAKGGGLVAEVENVIAALLSNADVKAAVAKEIADFKA